jgi:ribose transport system permease protein
VKTRREVLKALWNRWGIIIICAGWFLILSLLSDRFLTFQNLRNVFRQVAMLGLISFGMLLVVILGYMDLTVGVLMGLSGALYAGFSLNYSVWLALFIVLGVALFIGLVNGFLSTRGEGLSIIITLSMMSIIQGTTLLYTQGAPITGFPKTLNFLGDGYLGSIPWPVIILFVVGLIIHFFLDQMQAGQRFYAIGGNPQASRYSGINVNLYVISAYVMSAFLSTLAGLVLVGRVASAQPNAGQGEEFNAIGAVLIGGASLKGGVGSIIGVLIGVFVLGLISNGLNLLHVNPFFQYVVKGLIILVAVLLDQWGRK